MLTRLAVVLATQLLTDFLGDVEARRTPGADRVIDSIGAPTGSG
jgi:hypothetical protein